jgi:fatty-acyl-CoA synthase
VSAAVRPAAQTIPQLVDDVAARAPERPAVVAADRALSYGELAHESRRAAAGLARLGVGPGATVGLLCTNRADWLVTLVAAGRLGSPLAAFDTWSRAWDLEHLLTSSRTSVLVTLERFRGRDYVGVLRELVPELDRHEPGEWRSERFPDLREVVVIGDDVPRGARRFAELFGEQGDAPAPAAEATNDDVALILHTSGSTARPKGVPLLHGRLVENGFEIGERMGLEPDDRVWVAVPLFWSYGSANASMAAITHGATLVLQEVFEPAEGLDIIERHRCTAAYLLPNITAALTGHERFSPERTSSLRTGLTIGLPGEVRHAAEALGVAGICNIYGSTETYGNCCVTPSDLPLSRRLECQGPPLPGMSVRIVDPDTGAMLPAGETGQVIVGGRVATGYVGNPALTAETFTDDGRYRTGDLGYLDGEGHFHFVARESEMIKSGGINISPLEVETFLSHHPGVRVAAVVGFPDEQLGERAVAFVEPRRGTAVSADELRRHCAEGMAGYKVPAEIVICDELPLTDTGKLNRRALRERRPG